MDSGGEWWGRWAVGEPGRAGRNMRRKTLPKDVHRAPYTPTAPVQDMGVDHRRADIPVSEQFLYRPDVVAILEQMSGEGVAEGMAGDVFLDSGHPRRFLH